MAEKQRVLTGIQGLDELIEGGFPRQRTILVSGACGTGKSILGMQYVYNGLIKHEEPGVFVTFDELSEKIRQDMMGFGWNLKELEKNELFALIDGTSAKAGAHSEEAHALMPGQLDFDKVLVDILSVCRRVGAKRLVIDSVTAMGLHIGDEAKTRKEILRLSYVLARSGLTTIVTSEIPEQGLDVTRFSKYGIEEYVVDGIITLGFVVAGTKTPIRTLGVRKMRGTKHNLQKHEFEITDNGIIVKKPLKL